MRTSPISNLINDTDTDSGRELFGADTTKSNNTFATQGFDALRDLDSNLDGFITGADTAYAELKVWQDLNQDGISQAGELQSLAALGISSIGVNGTATGPQAGQLITGNRVDLIACLTQPCRYNYNYNYSRSRSRTRSSSQKTKKATGLVAACASIHWAGGHIGLRKNICKASSLTPQRSSFETLVNANIPH